jgi:nucleotide-binding universal stress UspA family protein
MDQHNAFNPNRILCPIDFSEFSSLALKYAAVGASEFNAELIVFHAELFEIPRYLTRNVENALIDQLRKTKIAVRNELRDHTERILGPLSRKLKIKYEVLDFHPVKAILNMAEKESVGLIVMGTHGYSGIKRFLLGSVTENIFRMTGIPIFTVRQKEHDFIDIHQADAVPHLKRILCPCSPTDASLPFLRVAVSMAERFHSRLTVLYISGAEQTSDSLESDLEELRLWISGAMEIHCEVSPMVRKGNTAEQIIAQACDENDDIIIIGVNHKPFLKETFVGRTTELVLRHAPVPVLAVPHVFTQ